MSRPDPARVFSALGDPVRLELLARLSRAGDLPVGRLVEGCGISRQGASKHLRILQAAGLVEALPQGRETRFRLRPGGLAEAQDHLSRIAQGWEDALARLRDHVEAKREDKG